MTLSFDKFLGGRFVAAQPRNGYRAGIDPVLLAAACTARSGQSVLELGIGAGVATLCLAARVPDLVHAGIELQPFYAGLAQRNARAMGINVEIAVSNIQDRPTAFSDRNFDHVIMNPPFFTQGKGTPADDTGRATGRSEQATISDWLGVAAKRVRPKGFVTLVQNMERLPDVLKYMPNSLGSIQIQPIAGRRPKSPNLFLLQACKNGRAKFHMKPTLTLYRADHHVDDHKDYTNQIEAVLKRAAALDCFT